jgi:hypothetical protein
MRAEAEQIKMKCKLCRRNLRRTNQHREEDRLCGLCKMKADQKSPYREWGIDSRLILRAGKNVILEGGN